MDQEREQRDVEGKEMKINRMQRNRSGKQNPTKTKSKGS